jgi:hypothetical protein
MDRRPARQGPQELIRRPIKMVAVHVSFHISNDGSYDLSDVLSRQERGHPS